MQFEQDINGIYVGDIQQSVSFPESGYDECFGVEKDSFWYNHRNNVINHIIHRFPLEGNFADVGGGNGYQAKCIGERFSDKKVFLIEPGYKGCLNAKNYGVEHVYNAPFHEFDFVNNNVGGIGLFDVIEHIEDDALFLKELSSLLQPGTFIYITVPAHKWLWSDNDDYAGHFRRYNTSMIRSLAQKTGLKLIYASYFMFYSPLLTFFARSLPYQLRGRRDTTVLIRQSLDNHRQGGFSGRFFSLLNKTEMVFLKTFGRVITGGSCIVVFQTQ